MSTIQLHKLTELTVSTLKPMFNGTRGWVIGKVSEDSPEGSSSIDVRFLDMTLHLPVEGNPGYSKGQLIALYTDPPIWDKVPSSEFKLPKIKIIEGKPL